MKIVELESKSDFEVAANEPILEGRLRKKFGKFSHVVRAGAYCGVVRANGQLWDWSYDPEDKSLVARRSE